MQEANATQPAAILLADDDPLSLNTIAQHLKSLGHVCQCVHDGDAAVAALAAEPFDLLISDIMMPGNPNLELIRKVPELAPGMPVILVTGSPSVQTAVDALHLPVMAYLIKPYNQTELEELVQRALEFSGLRRTGNQIFQRMGEWSRQAEAMREHLNSSASSSRLVDVNHFLALSIGNMMSAISDMQSLVLTNRASDPVLPCRLLECPQLKALHELGEETVAVIEDSKQYVKSKKLSGLRQSWETVLKNLGQ